MLVLLFAAACAGGSPQPTPRPTLTLTPLSTPLPYLETPAPPGSSASPVRWLLVTGQQGISQNRVAALANAAQQASGLRVTASLETSPRDALQAVCGSATGPVTMALVDPLAYAVARARGCADAALIVLRAGGLGITTAVVGKEERSLAAGSSTLPYCRRSAQDFTTGVVPLLMLRAQGLQSDIMGLPQDQPDDEASLQALQDGVCRLAMVDAAVYERLAEEDSPVVRDLRVLQRSAPMPVALLIVPVQFPLPNREQLIAALTTSDADAQANAALMQPIYGEVTLIRADDYDMAALQRFFEQGRLDLMLLGP
jgi:hypothetical protein